MNGSSGSTTFTDSSSNALAVTPYGNARISTDDSKFGGACAYFDGSGDYLVLTDAAVLEPGGGDWTWELWIKTSSSIQYATLVSRTPSGIGSGAWALMMNHASSTSGDLALYVGNYATNAPLIATSGVSVRDNAWHHIAVVRNGGAWTIYIDGVNRGTGTWAGAIADIAGNTYIGRDQSYVRDYSGYIDDLRFTKIARYTANFTPPAAPFADIQFVVNFPATSVQGDAACDGENLYVCTQSGSPGVFKKAPLQSL